LPAAGIVVVTTSIRPFGRRTAGEINMSTRSPRVPDSPALLSLRAAVIFTIAAVIGLAMGLLTYWSQGALPSALLAGLGATGGALLPLDRMIGR